MAAIDKSYTELQQNRKIVISKCKSTSFPLHSKPYGGGEWWIECNDELWVYNEYTTIWTSVHNSYPYNTSVAHVTSIKALVRHLRKQYLPKMSDSILVGNYSLYFKIVGYNLNQERKLFSELTGLPDIELEIDQEFGTSCYGTYTLQESPTLDTIEGIVGNIKQGLDKSTKAKNPKRVTFTYSIILQYLMLKGMLPHKVLFQIEY